MFNLFNLFSKEETVDASFSASSTVTYPVSTTDGQLLYDIFYGGSSRMSATEALRWYRDISSVSTCVDLISETCKQITPVLYDDVNEEYITDHPLLDLLDQPNGFDTYGEFITGLSKYHLISGNAYIVAIGHVDYEPVALHYPNIIDVNILPAVDNRPYSYNLVAGDVIGTFNRVNNTKELTRFIDSAKLKELYHLSRFSSGPDRLFGDSLLKAIKLEMKQQLNGRIHNISLLENGGSLSLVIMFKDEIPPPDEVVDARKKLVDERLAGVGNAGTVAAFSAADMDIKELGKTNRDMDYLNLDATASKAVYLRYGIPLAMVNNEASTYNNLEQSILYFYERTVLPHIKELFEAFNKFLLPRYQLDNKQYKLTYDPSTIAPIMRQKLAELEQRKTIGIETTNELRSLIPNREPLDGGDDLLVPASSTTLNNVISGDNESL